MASRPSDQGCVGGPATGVDEVVDVAVTPLPVVGLAEGPAVAGRAAEVDVEDREALGDEELLERHERAERLAGRAAMRLDDRRDPACPALAGRAAPAATACPRGEAVARLELDPFGHGSAPGRQRRRGARPASNRSPAAAAIHRARRPGRAAATGPAARNRARRPRRSRPRPPASRRPARRRPTD